MSTDTENDAVEPEVVEPDTPTEGEEELTGADKQEAEIDAIVPRTEHKVWEIGDREYTQKPLSYFQKMEFVSLMGQVVDRAMADGSLTVGGMMNSMGRDRQGNMSLVDLNDADTFVQGISRLLAYAPDLFERMYVIWLNVPPGERDYAIEQMRLPEDEGGMSDDMGIEIIETFLHQNIEAIEDFFDSKAPKLVATYKGLRAGAEERKKVRKARSTKRRGGKR